ncbi:MAG: LysR family transcriptional regulator [Pseudomonadota bacterium]
MDIELARTFLEIVRTGSFVAAAERLHVTQTTVTARMQNLEALLGCRLFVRNRNGASLTDNGERFSTHASQLVQIWESARRELPLPERVDSMLRLGGEISLWNPLLLGWLLQLRTRKPTLAVRVEVGEPRSLYKKVEQGLLDAVLVHQPEYSPGMQVEQLLEEKLVMVRSPNKDAPYIYIDWGEVFRQQHDTALPELARAEVTVDLGPLALQYLLQQGGSGYFRTRVVQAHLESGLLERVQSAPEFSYPVYLMYSRAREIALLPEAFAILQDSLVDGGDWQQVSAAPRT